MKLIGEGEHGKVYDMEDGTILKIVYSIAEPNLALSLQHKDLEYVANYKDVILYNDRTSDCNWHIVKEKIEPLDESKSIILNSLQYVWDECMVHKSDLWDYLSDYLKDTNARPLTLLLKYSIQKFLEHPLHFHTPFLELFMLIEELKLHGIYNIDWNPSNFGLKNNHLALFELGGAKMH